MSLLHGTALLCIGILYPIYSLWDGPKTKKYLTDHPNKLVTVYRQTIYIQLGLTALVMFAMHMASDSIEHIGIGFLDNGILTVGVLIMACAFLWFFRSVKLSRSKIESMKADYNDFNYIIPKSKKEYYWAIALSFLVGTMEEILFRGYIFWQLNQHIPLFVAVILTNLLFAILHLSTGTKNAISTFWIGMIYAALSFPFGTLWLAILAHIATDLYAVEFGYRVNQRKLP